MIEDFPALGRPTTRKTRNVFLYLGFRFFGKTFQYLVQQIARSRTAGCRHTKRIAQPERIKFSGVYCHSFESALFATKITGLSERRNIAATWSSRSTAPVFTSTMNKITSASSMAKATCLLISSSKISSELTTQPPVSITREFLRRAARPYRIARSRVVPASSLTIALRVSVRRLKRVDFPTFGRPPIATIFPIIPLSFYGSHSLYFLIFYSGIYPKPFNLFSRLRQSFSTFTYSSRKTFLSKNTSISFRAKVPTFFKAEPPFPDNNSFLRISLHIDNSHNMQYGFLFFLELFYRHLTSIRNLFIVRLQYFLADDLRYEEKRAGLSVRASFSKNGGDGGSNS